MRKQAQRSCVVCRRSHSTLAGKLGDSSRAGPEPQESFLLCPIPPWTLWNKYLLSCWIPTARAPGNKSKDELSNLFLWESHFSKWYLTQNPTIKDMWKGTVPLSLCQTPLKASEATRRDKDQGNQVVQMWCDLTSTNFSSPLVYSVLPYSPAQTPRAHHCSAPLSQPPPP